MEGTPTPAPPAKLSEKEKRKLRKKNKKEAKRQAADKAKDEVKETKPEVKVEIEYVVQNPIEELDESDPQNAELAEIIARFNRPRLDATQLAAEEAAAAAEEKKRKEEEAKKEKEKDDDDEDENKISKKQLKKQSRLTIALLKQLVKRPDVVEAWDVTSSDPKLLISLKGLRNSIPVPRHWNQKRGYLQGKRGMEKSAFSLPDFIAATGIAKIRSNIEDAGADDKKSKTKAREKLQPKLGKMDIAYEVIIID